MIRIRPHIYRSRPGFLVSGTVDGKRISIFTRTRRTAGHIKKKLTDGEPITLADFDKDDET